MSISFPCVETTVLKTQTTEDCWLAWIEQADGQLLKNTTIKQIRSNDSREQFLLVIDAVAHHMAEEIGLATNRVSMIPAGVECVGKRDVMYPATQHSIASGCSVEDISDSLFEDFDIHQRRKERNSYPAGLHEGILRCLIKYPALIPLVAFDTFCCNTDRSNPNIFYDVEHNKFCGIDMAASFRKPCLGYFACCFIKRLLLNKIIVDAELREVLIQYRDALINYSLFFPPSYQINLLATYAKDAGFLPGAYLYTPEVVDRWQSHERAMQENYDYCQELIVLLSEYLCVCEVS